MTNRAHMRLLTALSASMMTAEEVRTGLIRTGLMRNSLRRRQALTIANLPESKPVHPKRLLAELAEEFDRSGPPLSELSRMFEPLTVDDW